MSFLNDDVYFMKEALKEAEVAFEKGEVPVGAVLVKDGVVIARAHNLVECKQDASCHAEMLCLQKGAAFFNNWRLQGCTLYSTLEPCSMCAGSMYLFRLQKLVWGAKDLRHGANGSWVDLFISIHPIHNIQIVSGVLEAEAARLMKTFFQKRREAHV